MTKTPKERFWAKVDKSGECWLWTGAKNLQGYGKVGIRGKFYASHRLSYSWVYGDIPDGYVIDHICHNPSCVRPDHLRAATYKQNNENLQNKSGIRGVSWDKSRKKWLANVKHNGKTLNLGRFSSVEEASRVAMLKRNELFTHNDLDRISA